MKAFHTSAAPPAEVSSKCGIPPEWDVGFLGMMVQGCYQKKINVGTSPPPVLPSLGNSGPTIQARKLELKDFQTN